MRVGAIDIGTNTVRLLVADVEDGRLAEIDRRSRIAGLGRKVDRDGRLQEDAIVRALMALEGYGAVLRHFGAEAVRAVATSAARDATNRDRFFDRAGLALGARPELISGDEEAALSFRGATSSAGGPGPYLVIDPGGGSTEFVFGDAVPSYARSVDIGSVRVTERCLPNRPATAEDLSAATAEARRLMESVQLPGPPATVLGVASTPAAMAGLLLELPAFDRSAVDGYELTASAVDGLIERLARMTIEQTAALPSLDPPRARVILGGAIVVREALTVVGVDRLTVSDHDILDGIALALADR